jgi:hypothetical protein
MPYEPVEVLRELLGDREPFVEDAVRARVHRPDAEHAEACEEDEEADRDPDCQPGPEGQAPPPRPHARATATVHRHSVA